MGDGGVSIGTGALIAFLILAVGAVGILYGRCWERKSAAKAAAEAEASPTTDLNKLGESAKDLSSSINMASVKGRRSTLTMPKVDKKGKPQNAPPPRPPARKKTPPKRPPTFRANDYVSEV